jgi:hypothetical protein
MKIIIDNERSKLSGLLEGDKVQLRYTDYIIPDTTLAAQQLERWCWAAIGAGLANFYHNKIIQQHEVAAMVLGIDCTNFLIDEQLRQHCNVNFKLDKALAAVHCFSHWSFGKPTFERLQYELSCGHPVCCRIAWFKGDAHYVMINGFNVSNRTLYIQDPLTGGHKVNYEHFPDDYNGKSGVWTETYWTTKSIKHL